MSSSTSFEVAVIQVIIIIIIVIIIVIVIIVIVIIIIIILIIVIVIVIVAIVIIVIIIIIIISVFFCLSPQDVLDRCYFGFFFRSDPLRGSGNFRDTCVGYVLFLVGLSSVAGLVIYSRDLSFLSAS